MKKLLVTLLVNLLLISAVHAVQDSIDIYSDTDKSVFQIRVVHKQTGKKSSIGSGFIVVAPNILATNFHVVSGFVNEPDKYVLEYLSKDGKKGSVRILDLDITHDLAVLEADTNLGPPLEITDIPDKGARLFSLGNPLDLGFSIVEGVNNGIMKNSEEKNILVSGSLNPGMSGGPTLNEEGKVIGINVATSGNEISFLVSAEHLVKILERLKSRDFKAANDIYALISEQLVQNSQEKMDRVLKHEWGVTKIGKFNVPSELFETYRCWDASPNFKKEVLYSLTSSSCTNEYNIFLSGSLEVGGLAYEYHWLETEKLSPSRFYKAAYEKLNDSVPPSNAGKEDVTNFACTTRFINVSNVDFKATICRRDYLKYAGLSDVLTTIAMVGRKKQGFIFNLDLVGTDFSSAMDLLQKMLEKITWQH
ncbi:MAG: serine protease [Thiotrichaceae bacterium]